ncbi:MAG: peptidase [Legionellaceae bacterium]|nr:peptidase [Legionellaceae bacterium]HAF87842.1 peptidase [Legionellales bacterium]HCA88777.1 peptidase [Legionellales bacterium]
MIKLTGRYNTIFLACLNLVTLSSCTQQVHHLAPVTEITWHAYKAQCSLHQVKPKETLYAIAFRYDKDVQKLARLNHLRPPYKLKVGQIIYLNQPKKPHKTTPLPASSKHLLPKNHPKVARNHSIPIKTSQWCWPVKGIIMTYFSPNLGRKGLDIKSRQGQKVHAAQAGIVAYAGNGLTGYGNLIIIKHDHHILTAYAHNKRNFVHEGQKIKANQIIAEIGRVNRTTWGVHFEIRQAGQPVNPMRYLR